MEKNEFGVWSLTLPDVDGKPAIEHGSKVKIRLRKSNGSWADCIPAWIKWATVDPNQFSAAYDGIYWEPRASEREYEVQKDARASDDGPFPELSDWIRQTIRDHAAVNSDMDLLWH
ncbi:unnamed protein product [Calypogeia fissa]